MMDGLKPYPAYKDSGVEWLGRLPAHWEVRNLSQIASSFRTGPFGSVLHQSEYVEGGTPIVNPKHMRNGHIFADHKCSVPPSVAERLTHYTLELNDIVFARRGKLGRCALVREPEAGWICGTGSLRVRVKYVNLEPEYLILVLQMPLVEEYLSLFSVGATMDNLNTGILKGLPILCPPIDEQRRILDMAARNTETLARVAEAGRRGIELLQEYRTRLIADVVTGKVDVREVAVRLPEESAEEEMELAEADEVAEQEAEALEEEEEADA